MITLYLMSEKGFRVIQSLVNTPHAANITCVIGARDSNVLEDYYEEIKNVCGQHNIPFFDKNQPADKNTGYKIAISWRWMLDDVEKLIIIHDSLLPRYRGFAPLVNCLINGEKEIGATALFAKEGYDTGDIIIQRSISVNYPFSIADAISAVSDVYVTIVQDIFGMVAEGKTLMATSQDASKATYSLWRDEDDYRIDWTDNAEKINRFIMAVGFPYKGASTLAGGILFRIRRATVISDVTIENRTPGKVIFIENDKPTVVCGEGLLRIDEMVFDDGSAALPIKKFRTKFS